MAVPAADALGKAWSLAAGRLQTAASDPQRRGLLKALGAAKLDGAPSLSAAQLAGTYGAFPNAVVVTAGGDGTLDLQQQQPDSAEIPLVREGGDRYRPAAFSSGFSMTFVFRGGKIDLLKSDPRESLLLPKQ